MIPTLFIDGPAHGKVLHMHPDAYTHIVEDEPTEPVTMFRVRKRIVYCPGFFSLPKQFAFSPDRIVRIATPNGEHPTVNGHEIWRLAALAGVKDQRGVPV